MRWISRLARRLKALGTRGLLEREMDEEMRAHLEMEIEDRIRSGASPEEARRTALRDFGAVDRFKEEGREARGIGWMEAFRQDVRFTARSLMKTPAFAAVAVLTLGLGIGATTSIFSLVEGVLLRPLPYPSPDRLVWVRQTSADGGMSSFSYPNFTDLKERTSSFTGLAAYSSWVVPVSAAGESARVPVAAVSEDFFRVMGAQPTIGRGFTAEEWRAAPTVAIVSADYWRTRLSGAAEPGGTPIRIGSDVLTVVGVMPDGFEFPEAVGIWFPHGPQGSTSRTAHSWQVVGRLREGLTVEAATGEIDRIAGELKALYGDDTNMSGATMIPLHERTVGSIRTPLLVLLAASGLLLAIACANVVSLLLARAAGRRRELAVRLALGAGRGRLTRQFLAESLLLCMAGGALGAAIAWAGVRTLTALDNGRIPRLGEVGVSGPVLAFVIGVTVLCAVALGLFTALRAARGDVREALTEGSRTQSGGTGSHRVRAVLTVVQVALTVVLQLGAGLLGRSFLSLMAVDPGYRTEDALVMDLLMPSGEGAEGARLLRMQDEIMAAIAAAPGVSHVGTVDVLPLSDYGSNGTFIIVDSPDEVTTWDDFSRLSKDSGRTGTANYRTATGGYFRAMGIPLVRGRLFDERDHPDAPHVAVISEELAEARWPDQDPIGRMIQFGNMDGDLRVFTIVGVVGDIRETGLDQQPSPTFYGNARQRPNSIGGTRNFVITGDFDRAGVTAIARRAVREHDAEIPIRFRTIEEVFSASLSARRFSLVLLGAFSVAALLLAVTGIYGVVSYVVAQRTREIGIRLALGAPGGKVLRQVVGRGLVLTLAGVVLGLVVALGATRVLSGLLYGVGARDLQTFLAVPLLLFAVATLASYLPARRAARVDPVVAMRYE